MLLYGKEYKDIDDICEKIAAVYGISSEAVEREIFSVYKGLRAFKRMKGWTNNSRKRLGLPLFRKSYAERKRRRAKNKIASKNFKKYSARKRQKEKAIKYYEVFYGKNGSDKE